MAAWDVQCWLVSLLHRSVIQKTQYAILSAEERERDGKREMERERTRTKQKSNFIAFQHRVKTHRSVATLFSLFFCDAIWPIGRHYRNTTQSVLLLRTIVPPSSQIRTDLWLKLWFRKIEHYTFTHHRRTVDHLGWTMDGPRVSWCRWWRWCCYSYSKI